IEGGVLQLPGHFKLRLAGVRPVIDPKKFAESQVGVCELRLGICKLRLLVGHSSFQQFRRATVPPAFSVLHRGPAPNFRGHEPSSDLTADHKMLLARPSPLCCALLAARIPVSRSAAGQSRTGSKPRHRCKGFAARESTRRNPPDEGWTGLVFVVCPRSRTKSPTADNRRALRLIRPVPLPVFCVR